MAVSRTNKKIPETLTKHDIQDWEEEKNGERKY